MQKITITNIGSRFNLSGQTIKNWILENPDLKNKLTYKTHKQFAEEDFEIIRQFILEKYNLI